MLETHKLGDGRAVSIMYTSGRVGIGYHEEMDSACGSRQSFAVCEKCQVRWVCDENPAPHLCPKCGERPIQIERFLHEHKIPEILAKFPFVEEIIVPYQRVWGPGAKHDVPEDANS